MIKISVIAPYEEFAVLFAEIFEKHNANPYKPEYETEDYRLEIIRAESITDLVDRTFDTDVIVARSGFVYFLRRHHSFIPVVEIPIAGNDLMHALDECRKRGFVDRIGLIGSSNMILGVERIAKIIGVEVTTYLYPDDSNSAMLVNQAYEQGIKMIIGGVKSGKNARKLGIESFLIKSGPESIWQAITEAKRTAYLSRREQEKAEMQKAILDYAFEGVIATDNQQNIAVFNEAARKIFDTGLHTPLGLPAEAALKNGELAALLGKERKSLNELVTVKGTKLSVNMIPIILKGEPAGKVLTFQEVSRIQEMESSIRERIYSRGHVAKHDFESIIGTSPALKSAIGTARHYSRTDSSVLINGKTGTGKELFAQSIHNCSRRSKEPFVAVNCASLPESLLESELFGYVEGAFTGATKGGKPGLFELAHGGTILLDEISETDLRLQGQLLRVIQEKEIRRIGHDRVLPVDVRVITTSNKDLHLLVQKGLFREDLLYRINVLNLRLPSLSERREDIAPLARHFLAEFACANGCPPLAFSEKALAALEEYGWPGNVRQLKNICERLAVLCEKEAVDGEDIDRVLADHSAPAETALLGEELRGIERARIAAALAANRYNKVRTAKALGIDRSTLWRRMKDFGLNE